MKFFKNRIIRIISLSMLYIQLILMPAVLRSQSIESINDEPGAGGSTQSSVDEGGSSSALFIIFGVAVAVILLYKFVLSEEEPEAEDQPKSDSTGVSKSKLFNSINSEATPAYLTD